MASSWCNSTASSVASARCDELASHLLDRLAIDHLEPRLGERLGAHVAADHGPLVMLLGEHHPDESDHRGPVGEDAHNVGATADLLVQPLLGVDAPMSNNGRWCRLATGSQGRWERARVRCSA